MPRTHISDRKFGWQFGIAIGLVSLLGAWQGLWQWLVLLLALLSLSHFMLAWLAPSILRQINHAWMALGHFMGRALNPVILGLMFVVLIVPSALIMRLKGRDELLLRDRSGESFWVLRKETTVSSGSFRHQY